MTQTGKQTLAHTVAITHTITHLPRGQPSEDAVRGDGAVSGALIGDGRLIGHLRGCHGHYVLGFEQGHKGVGGVQARQVTLCALKGLTAAGREKERSSVSCQCV